MSCQPRCAGIGGRGGGGNQRRARAVSDGKQGMVPIAERDQRGAAGRMRNSRGGELGCHAARADTGISIRAGRHRVMFGGQLVEAGNMRCLRVGARIRRVEAVNIRQEHQHIRAHHLGDARGQPVIVAIANLVSRHRVILIDDRHHA